MASAVIVGAELQAQVVDVRLEHRVALSVVFPGTIASLLIGSNKR
ncbi:MAG: hypothetical protein RLZZ553_525 [Verrucomicrobiota bacterium]